MKLPVLPNKIDHMDVTPEHKSYYDTEMMLQFQQDTIKACIDVISDEQDKVECNWQCKDGVHIVWKLKELK